MNILHIDRQRSWTGQINREFQLLRELNNRGHQAGVICHPGAEIGKRGRRKGLTVLETPLRGSEVWPSIPELGQRLRNTGVDLLHAHGSRDHQVALAVSWMANIPHVVRTKHNHTRFHSGMFSRIPYHLSDHVITVSEFVRRQLVEDGLLARRLTAIPSGVDVDRFHPEPDDPVKRNERGIPEDDVVIGTISSLNRRKGVEDILKATARLVNTGHGGRLTLLLLGRNMDLWDELVEELDLEPYIHCPGFVEDPARYFPLFDVFLHPSRQEALGTAVLEAMAAERPVVATRTGGQMESVTDETGILVPVRDPDALASATRALLTNPDRREEMGQKARERVVNHFSVRAMARRTLEMYRNILN